MSIAGSVSHKASYAGIDGGGTKTTCVVYDLRTGAIGHGRAGPLNINYVSVATARQAVQSAVAKACAVAGSQPQQLSAAGVAAPWTEEIVGEVLTTMGAGDCRVEAWGEDACALMATLCQPAGLILIAGTGSRCAYLSPDAGSPPVVAGAWGSLFGDEGSGYAIGAAALRAVTQAWDGRGPATALAEAVMDQWRLATEKDLVRAVYAGPAGSWRYRIASLCPLVGRVAAASDPVAQAILEDAARELGRMVESVVRRAQLTVPVRAATAGGVFGLGRQITKPLAQTLSRQGLEVELVPERLPPAYGALLLSLPRELVRADQSITARLVAYHGVQGALSDTGTQSPVMYNGPKKPEPRGGGRG